MKFEEVQQYIPYNAIITFEYKQWNYVMNLLMSRKKEG